MEPLKKALHKLLFPGKAVVLLSVLLSAFLLAYTFSSDTQHASPVAYIAYLVSAYSLTVVCTNGFLLFRKGAGFARQNVWVNRYITDVPFRVHISLYLSLAINILYAVIKFISGVHYRSLWLVSIAVYYGLLALMRFLLLWRESPQSIEKNRRSALRRYRFCGIILLLMNQALAVIVLLIVQQNSRYEYPGTLIYLMAAYAFYSIIIATKNFIKYRKHHSPILAAAKAINLAAALVSILSLETAMLARFGSPKDAAFQQQMVAATGGFICVVILGMAVSMIVRSSKEIKNSRSSYTV